MFSLSLSLSSFRTGKAAYRVRCLAPRARSSEQVRPQDSCTAY